MTPKHLIKATSYDFTSGSYIVHGQEKTINKILHCVVFVHVFNHDNDHVLIEDFSFC